MDVQAFFPYKNGASIASSSGWYFSINDKDTFQKIPGKSFEMMLTLFQISARQGQFCSGFFPDVRIMPYPITCWYPDQCPGWFLFSVLP
jgi:hypothetical protein